MSFSESLVTRAAVDELFTILSYMRPHESLQEQKFVKEFLLPLGVIADSFGNYHKRVGNVPILWSCHIDTVHRFGGIAPVAVNADGIIKVHPKSKANCLGADDGAGVWLMIQMIRAERPGHYIFHRGEEQGCKGSRWLASNWQKTLSKYKAAIAFDRKGTGSIITHQFGGRCCSETFSKSLSDAIGLGMKSDDGGTVTDTAQYTDYIGECTNVSVGYYGQHGSTEEQDLPFLLQLCEKMLVLDTSKLVYARKPGEKEARVYRGHNFQTSNRGQYQGNDYFDDGFGGGFTDADLGDAWMADNGYKWDPTTHSYKAMSEFEMSKHAAAIAGKKSGTITSTATSAGTKRHDKSGGQQAAKGPKRRDVVYPDPKTKVVMRVTDAGRVPETYEALVRDYPDQIASLLSDKDYGLSYLQTEIRKRGGVVIGGFDTKQ